MPSWDYRVVRTRVPDDREPYYTYAIHEAHYDAPDAEPGSISAGAMTTSFESVDELRAALVRMLMSLEKPALDYEDF